MTEDTHVTFRVDNSDVAASLQELYTTDVTEVEENYGPERLPAGTYQFRCKNAEIITREMAFDKKKHPDKMVDRAIYSFELEVVNVLSLKDPSLSEADYIGSIHYESFTIFDFRKDTGKMKALMTGSGYVPPSNQIGDMLSGFIGHEFLAVITQRKDRNNPDTIYSNISLKEVQPVSVQESPVSQPPAPPAQSAVKSFSL